MFDNIGNKIIDKIAYAFLAFCVIAKCFISYIDQLNFVNYSNASAIFIVMKSLNK
jgi:hypothetical protein